MPQYPVFPVGQPGVAWGEAERAAWRALQTKKRDYFTDVVSPLMRMSVGEVFSYGSLDYRTHGAAVYPLYAVKSAAWDASRPMVLVTGGVHGYETSGVHGALLFLRRHMVAFSAKVNILVLPCVCPWGYETVNRWTPAAVDPNRSFNPEDPGTDEARLAMAVIREHVARSTNILVHTDLHETTDTDNSEFMPAKFARDGTLPYPEWDPIPDGFYLVGDCDRMELEFDAAVISAVAKVTHIAPPDARGTIIGEQVRQEGCIYYPGKKLYLCGAHTDAKYATTTEVYPDSSRATPEMCNEAQVTVVITAIDFALQHHTPQA